MHFTKESDGTHIHCDEGESEQDVLRAIVIASFSSAASVGMGLMRWQADTQMTGEMADQFIKLDNPRVLYMEYVEGRQCQTVLDRVEPGHFTLEDRRYERDRGNPSVMLDTAKVLLAGETPIDITSTMYLYEGDALDKRAPEYFYKSGDDYKRRASESDWEYRKRIFVDFYDLCHDEALCFIMGGTLADFDELENMLVLINAKSFGTRSGCKHFADGFAGDPLENRKAILTERPASSTRVPTDPRKRPHGLVFRGSFPFYS